MHKIKDIYVVYICRINTLQSTPRLVTCIFNNLLTHTDFLNVKLVK